nr:MurR/RpiR family transcriptional regulator [Achromobacter sp. UMC71]
MSPRLQVAARFVIDHPNEVVIASMRTLAERAGVPPATLVRLAQQLGYGGWPDLKSAFADDLGLNGKGYGERARSLARRSRRPDLLDDLFLAQQTALAATAEQCLPALKAAAKLLKQARQVHVAGFRASFPIAYSLVYGYRLFRNSVQLVDGLGGNLQMQLRAIEPKDVVVAISFAPYSSESLVVAQAAQAAGAPLIALTDSDASPLARAAQVAVLYSVAGASFFPSVTAAMGVTEALLGLLVAEGGDDVAARLQRNERDLVESGAYLPVGSRY